jgi:hypothetical protein
MRLRRAQMEALSGQAGSSDTANTLIEHVEPIIPLLGARRQEARAWALAARASIDIMRNDLIAAQYETKAAADLADTMPDAFDLDTRLVFRQREAYTDIRQGNFSHADALLRDLEQRQLALHGPLHPDTLLLQLTVAKNLLAQKSYSAAAEMLNRLYPSVVAVFGADNRQTLLALMAREQANVMLERYDDAVSDDMKIYQLTVAKQGEHALMALISLNDAAIALCRGGREKEGFDDVKRAYDAADATFGPKSAYGQTIAQSLAFCLIKLKQYSEAASLLDGLDRAATARASMDADMDAEIDLMQADIAIAAGDLPRARGLLQAPIKAFSRNQTDPYLTRWTDRLSELTR